MDRWVTGVCFAILIATRLRLKYGRLVLALRTYMMVRNMHLFLQTYPSFIPSLIWIGILLMTSFLDLGESLCIEEVRSDTSAPLFSY